MFDIHVIAVSTHWLYTFLLRHIGNLLFIMSLFLLNAIHPTTMLLLISSVLSFCIVTGCPRYTYSSTLSILMVLTCTSIYLENLLNITLVFFMFIFLLNLLLSSFNWLIIS